MSLPLDSDGYPRADAVQRSPADADATRSANRRWWNRAAPAYLREHGQDLGVADFLWCPEGLRESEALLLGEVSGRSVLEVGCGSAPCSRWLATQGALPVGLDLSDRMLAEAAAYGERAGIAVPLVQGDATALPFGARSFDIVCSAFGGFPFVADAGAALAQVARVLRPAGRFVFSVSHPFHWVFPDDSDPAHLQVTGSYFNRLPYVELDAEGRPMYVEHHRTIGDWVRLLVDAGLHLEDVVEPTWQPGREVVWGYWSAARAALIPGTAIFCATLPSG
ncbi:MAG: class I SAM-dependent methyltransferase [Geodermatophilaceae bacterium]|jgi:SAM-dependent methyltransferase